MQIPGQDNLAVPLIGVSPDVIDSERVILIRASASRDLRNFFLSEAKEITIFCGFKKKIHERDKKCNKR